ncbi:MAG TPA: ATP-binding protein [Propionibacteriaceae bacterium]|nr:ATP-binding protein [Propionibacteriaceae bacterium]
MATGILIDMPGRITSAAFVGRKDQLGRLHDAFAATLTTPAVVLIGGEAGVGKTRLVYEFAVGIPEARVLVGTCLELGQAVALPAVSARCLSWFPKA